MPFMTTCFGDTGVKNSNICAQLYQTPCECRSNKPSTATYQVFLSMKRHRGGAHILKFVQTKLLRFFVVRHLSDIEPVLIHGISVHGHISFEKDTNQIIHSEVLV